MANTVVSFLLESISTSYKMVKTNRKRLLRTLNFATRHAISDVSGKARVSAKTGQLDAHFKIEMGCSKGCARNALLP